MRGKLMISSDADLLGMPLRLTISKRTCKEKKIELKFRSESKSDLLTHKEILKRIKDFCA
jgi:prolyl-tRNA synthetase